MKEKELINIIKTVTDSKYIGDDCAYLKELGIVVTQDNLVEDVHFSMKFMTPFQLGYKSAMVNISDICASGAEPRYLTAGLSLPKDISADFVKNFYKGFTSALENEEIAGGDITGSDKIMISVTAIGKTEKRKISSRKHAKFGDKIIVSGIHGSSGAGLKLLMTDRKAPEKFIKAHLEPSAQRIFSKVISENIKENYAMMDTSDGLMDALTAIAGESGVKISVDFEKIPYDRDLEHFESLEDIVLYGGEDYQLIASVSDDFIKNILNNCKSDGFYYKIIGEVKPGLGVEINFKDKRETYTIKEVETKLYNHFEER